jgi:lipopolysaccharide/colanic/teichoic acid biosynthesis glycosyltransferase
VKRGLDICVAALGLVLLSPLLLASALAIRLTIGAPVLFRQKRPGLHGRSFTLVKFRSMRNVSRSEDVDDAQRLTRLGSLLRRTSLDELPELWNVLIGDMSLVGPRPLLMEYLPLYTPQQARRHEVRPGLTGWAQINGRNATSWEQRLALDTWYVDNQSLALDLKILAMTVPKVLRAEGVSQPGQSTMAKFRGSGSG